MERKLVKDGDGLTARKLNAYKSNPSKSNRAENAGIAETPNNTLGRIRKVRALIDPDRLARVYNPVSRLVNLSGVWIPGPGVIDRGSVG